MGASDLSCCLASLSTDNWIDMAGILINVALGIYLIVTVQNNLSNRRILKDHFINEVKEIQTDFKAFFKNIESGTLLPGDVIPWFKLMNIKVTDVMEHLTSNYKIDKDYLISYQVELRNMTTDSDEYIAQFNGGIGIVFNAATKVQYYKFQKDNLQLFNKLIISINNAK